MDALKFNKIAAALLGAVLLIMVFGIVEWLGREEQFAISNLRNIKSPIIRFFLYYLIAFAILIVSIATVVVRFRNSKYLKIDSKKSNEL